MSAGYAPCSCQQAEELTARVRELEELLREVLSVVGMPFGHPGDGGLRARLDAALKVTP